MFRPRLALAVVLFISALAPIRAQVVGGTISGIATDSTGAALSNAAVLLHNEETGSERRLTTDSSGAYSAPSIPVGRYTITVSHDGFAAQIRTDIVLTIGQALHINIALSTGEVAQQVTVTDTPPWSTSPPNRPPAWWTSARSKTFPSTAVLMIS